MKNNFKDMVIHDLEKLPIHNLRNLDYIEIKCPYCGDTDKHTDHGHMYIMNYSKRNKPLVYYCHKCLVAGTVTPDFMELINLYDPTYESLYKKDSKNYIYESNKRGLYTNNNSILIKSPYDTPQNRLKIKYINDRLGIKLTTKKILQYKIIFNILDFLNYNNIRTYTRHEYVMKALDEQYLGFVSTKNEFINMRNVGKIDKTLKRYINYNIFNYEDNSKRFYIPTTKVDIMKPVTICMAEGPFDIIGIKEHFYNDIDLSKNKENYIFAASMGVSYEALIRYLSKLGFIIDVKYNIFSDNSLPLTFYRKLKKKLGSGYVDKMNIYYNSYTTRNEKADFGVPKNEIILDKYTI